MRTRGGADHAWPAFDVDVVDRLRLPRSVRSPLIRLWSSGPSSRPSPPAWFGDLYAIE